MSRAPTNALHLRKITEPEYLEWREQAGKSYAADMAKTGMSEADALAEMERSYARLLPQGRDTPNHHIYSLVLHGNELAIGTLWWGLQQQPVNPQPWIYDVYLEPSQRGKGLGRIAMELAQVDVKAKGYNRLGLHVFGHNKVAQNLYQSLGFEAKNIVMFKELV